MGNFNISGIASGLDTKTIISQLMDIESRGKVKTEWTKGLWTARRDAWNAVEAKLTNLKSAANKLSSSATWQGGNTAASSAPAVATAMGVGAAAAASGSYALNVTQLATNETWGAAAGLIGDTPGKRTTGTMFEALNDPVEGTDPLTNLRDATGTAVGLNNGSTITMRWEQDGRTFSSTFNVATGNTVDQLRGWAQTQIPGSTVALVGGKMEVTSPGGTHGEVTSLSFDAKNNIGTALTRFNGSPGASSSMTTAASDGGASAGDTLTINQNGKNWYVSVAKGDSVQDIANKVNAVSGVGVTASLNGTGKLQMTSNTGGAVGSFTVSSSGALATTLSLAELTAGQDASYTLNGGAAKTSATNTGITDVIPGLKVDLLTVGATTLNVAAGSTADATKIKAAVKDFVESYNATLSDVRSKYSEKRVASPTNGADFAKAPLGGSGGLLSIENGLRNWTGAPISGATAAYDTLAEIGISTGAASGSGSYTRDAVTGKLVIDEAKLDAAIAADPAAVRAAFDKTGSSISDQGVARRVSGLVDAWRSAGGPVGSGEAGAERQISDLNRRLSAWEDRLGMRQKRFETQFTHMETMMGQMQSRSAQLQAQISKM